jgi:putative heme-binding domain-containing protein
MRLSFVCLVLLSTLFLVEGRAQKPNVAASKHRSPAEEKKAFRLPPGFEAQLVAAEPDIHKPINIAFDDQGRLWVTDTVEYPYAADPRKKKPRDTVKVLEDFGPDGRARKITTFAGGLNIPIGVLPLPGASPREALVYSIPQILRLRGGNEREVMVATYGFRDTHGMTSAFTLGFDGWVYACHGYANTSTLAGKDRKKVTMQSGNTYRFRPDGGTLEQWTWGQVNPFGLSLDPWGNLYSADCHSQPIYQLLRGGYYPSFGKPDDGLGFAPEMITGYKGSTAISGIAFYAADAFPARYRQSAFIGDVMTNQVVEFKMTWAGSTPRATVDVFLDSADPWFRPVDVKLGPDGALYVADFYNRIIGHYEVPLNHPGRDRTSGRIWRIVSTGKDHKGTPAPRQDWTKAGVNDLFADLRHPNLTVRLLATQELAHRGGKEIREAARAVLAGKESADAPAEHSHALWVLERLGGLDDGLLGQAFREKGALARNHAQRILAGRTNWTPACRAIALAGLKDPSPHVQRAAADALGQHADPANVRPLLELRHKVPAADTHLLHVVRMALRNQLRPAETWRRLAGAKWSAADARALADVCLGVRSPEAAHFLVGHVQTAALPDGDLTRFAHAIARHGDAQDVKALVTFCRASRPGDLSHQGRLVREAARGAEERGQPLTPEARAWAVEVTGKLLAAKDGGAVRRGAVLAGALRLAALQGRLANLAADRGALGEVRLAAMNALAAIDVQKSAKALGAVLADAGSPTPMREHAAGLLARANQPETRALLLAALPAAPAPLQHSIAEGLAASREGAEKLLAAVALGKASARLLQERAVTVRLENARLPDLKNRLAKLTAGLPAADARLQQVIAARRKGYLAAKPNLARGALVYAKSCAVCHPLGGKGAKIGPQLDGIGLRGLDRLLEDTLDPNRNVDQAFRTTSLTLTRGQVVQGLLLREEGAVLVLADQEGKEVRVPKKDVEERSVSQMSPMPAGVAEKLPEGEYYDLLGYLLSQKPVRR